jgi:hypothetical protein
MATLSWQARFPKWILELSDVCRSGLARPRRKKSAQETRLSQLAQVVERRGAYFADAAPSNSLSLVILEKFALCSPDFLKSAGKPILIDGFGQSRIRGEGCC